MIFQWPNDEILKNILKSALETIQSISAECYSYYSRPDYINHYLRVSKKLFAYSNRDENLALAGFLHGLPLNLLAKLELANNRAIKEILSNFQKLIEINPNDEDVCSKIEGDILPQIQEPNSIILFLVSQFDHYDPDDQLSEWTINFCKQANLFDREINIIPFCSNNEKKAHNPAFLSKVLSKVAKFWGFWNERNIAENLSLYHSNASLFNNICIFAVRSEKENGPIKKRIEIIENALKELKAEEWQLPIRGWDYNPRWEWRHVASIAKRIDGSKDNSSWFQSLDRCGYITLTCPDVRSCYSMLGYLHTKYQYRIDGLKDYIGHGLYDELKGRIKTGYKALHLKIVTHDKSIAVRLIPKKYDLRRFSKTRHDEFKDMVNYLVSNKFKLLRVYSPSGKPVHLPPGSTVMNFAFNIHNDILPFIEGATINETKNVDPFYKLKDGDVIDLKISQAPIMFRDDWELALPKSTQTKIRKRYDKTLRESRGSYYQLRGKYFLLQNLAKKGYEISNSDSNFDNILIEASRSSMPSKAVTEKPLDEWWLYQLGLFEESLNTRSNNSSLKIDRGTANRFISKFSYLLEKSFQLSCDIEFDTSTVQPEALPVSCDDCHPNTNCEISVEVSKHSFIVHRRSSACAKNSIPAKWVKKIIQPKYYVIETTNRIGIASDILSVFKEFNIDLIDISGRKLGVSWGVIRVQVEQIVKATQSELLDLLKNINGVIKVYTPDDQIVPALEISLPPRRKEISLPLKRVSPYIVGEIITNDSYFYGREKETQKLLEVYETIIASKNTRNILIEAPFKVGKSSLLLNFFRKIDEIEDNDCITAYIEASRKDRWTDIEKYLNNALLYKLECKNIYKKGHKSNMVFITNNIYETIKSIRKNLPSHRIILAIDEIAGLFVNIGGSKNQTQNFDYFIRTINNLGNILIVWIGPSGPLLKMSSSLPLITRASTKIEIEPFSIESTDALLRTANNQCINDIRLVAGVSKETKRFTGGNPYWISRLGELMWKQADIPQSFSIIYTKEMLELAKAQIVLDDELFVDRVRFKGRVNKDFMLPDDNNNLLWHLLKFFVSNNEKKHELDMRIFMHEDLLAKAKYNNNIFIKSSLEIEDMLHELEAWGSIERINRDGKLGWKISSPAIHDYISLNI